MADLPIGFAGGLGPDNLEAELPKIAAAAAGRPYWVDMESSLRDADDWFDMTKARRAIEIVRRFRAESPQ